LQTLGPQEARPELRRHQFTGRHHSRAGPVADFADQGNSRGNVLQLRQIPLYFGTDRDPQLRGEARMALFNGSHFRLVLLR
jgi:hypothetical protein